MTGNEYQMLAARTMKPDLTVEGTIYHALLGLASEVGEITGLYQKELQGHIITEEHFLKEVGDALWMIAELLTATGHCMEDAMKLNIEKLMARYPEGFDQDKSINRAKGDI